ncbi:MAG: PHB depolymerase family esterase [Hyphomonadaceae bacterium]|nr:PHB depolymerase family esterase [Hyphomonadaceae bacterium]
MKRLFASMTLLALASCSAAAQPGPTSGKLTDETMQHGGMTRRYLVHDYSDGKPAPVVIVLHGGGGHPENAVNMSQMDVVAAREHFIAVYPGGTGGMPGGKLLTWNAGHCCAYAREKKIDDVGFIAKIIDTLVASGRADPKRVYVTGMSNGAMMSHVLARELPERIAAIGPIVGAVFGDEPPPKAPVAAIIFVGATDQTVPAAGGPLGGPERRGVAANLARRPEDHDVAPDINQAEYWAKANGCAAPVLSSGGQPKPAEVRWEKCTSGKPVHFYRVANNGHAWPGGKAGRAEADQPTPEFNASEVMWRFFAANPKK